MSKTKFEDGRTVITAEFLNKMYGGDPDSNVQEEREGHVHDGSDEDGHAGKIDLNLHVKGTLDGQRIKDNSIDYSSIKIFDTAELGIPVSITDSSGTRYLINPNTIAAGSEDEIQYNSSGALDSHQDFRYVRYGESGSELILKGDFKITSTDFLLNPVYSKISVSVDQSRDISYTLPSEINNDGYLKVNSSGELEWATVTGGGSAPAGLENTFQYNGGSGSFNSDGGFYIEPDEGYGSKIVISSTGTNSTTLKTIGGGIILGNESFSYNQVVTSSAQSNSRILILPENAGAANLSLNIESVSPVSGDNGEDEYVLRWGNVVSQALASLPPGSIVTVSDTQDEKQFKSLDGFTVNLSDSVVNLEVGDSANNGSINVYGDLSVFKPGSEIKNTLATASGQSVSLFYNFPPTSGSSGQYLQISNTANGEYTLGWNSVASSAPTDAEYLVLSADSTLSNEKVFTVDTALLSFTTGPSSYNLSLSSDVIVSGNDISLLNNDAGYVTTSGAPTDAEYLVLSADSTLSNEKVFTVDTALLSFTTGPSSYNLSLSSDVVVAGNNISILNNDEGFLKNVVEDTTPQLGGNLDAQNNSIDNVSALSYDNGSPMEINVSDASLDFNSQIGSSTNVCDYNFGGEGTGGSSKPASINLAAGGAGSGYFNIQAKNGSSAEQVVKLPGSTPSSTGQVLSVSSLANSNKQIELAWTTPSSGGAPTNAEYLVLSADATLSNEKVFSVDTAYLSFTTGPSSYNLSLSSDVIVSGNDISLLNNDAGYVTTSGAPTDAEYLVLSADATLSNEKVFSVDTAFLSFTTGPSSYNLSLSSDVIVSGNDISLLNNDAGYVTTSGAPTNAEYLVLSANATLSNEKVFSVDTAFLSFTTGPSSYNLSLSSDVIVDGDNISRLNNDAGYVTSSGAPTDAQYLVLSADSALSNERVLSVDTAGLTLTTTSNSASISLNSSVIKSGDNISELNNDSGFVNGLKSVVVLDTLDGAVTGSNPSATWKYSLNPSAASETMHIINSSSIGNLVGGTGKILLEVSDTTGFDSGFVFTVVNDGNSSISVTLEGGTGASYLSGPNNGANFSALSGSSIGDGKSSSYLLRKSGSVVTIYKYSQ